MKRAKVKDGREDEDNGFAQWGGYMDAKISKLEEQFDSNAKNNPYKKSDLFANISVYVNGLTNPSSDEIKRIMMVHGGTFHHYKRSYTTYEIAATLPDTKVRHRNVSKVIRPEWITDCLKENKILDYTNYLLHSKGMYGQQTINLPKTDTIVTEAPKKGYARTAVDPNFLTEFYNNSRLHHIATLGAEFKQLVTQWRENQNKTFPARQELKLKFPNKQIIDQIDQYIMHIDMDCFFVSVGLRSRPELKNYPVVVTHSKGGNPSANRSNMENREKELELHLKRLREKLKDNVNGDNSTELRSFFEGTDSLSEIASCSYEARKFGVKNGMFFGQAIKLCPNLIPISYDFEGYKEVANILYGTIAKYTLDIEAVSCDEMYVDLTDLLKDLNLTNPMDLIEVLRNEIKNKTKCPCSAGVGTNRLLARLATKKAKPDGQFLIKLEKANQYMLNISVEELPGVGYSNKQKLFAMNLKTCQDVQQVPMSTLQEKFGKKHGESLYKMCRGIDDRPLIFDQERKSVSVEVNYGIRFKENTELETFLLQLCEELIKRLNAIQRMGRVVTLKYMVRAEEAPVETSKFMGHGICDHITKSITLTKPTNLCDVVYNTVTKIKNQLKVDPSELRGIGIHLGKLEKIGKCNYSTGIMEFFKASTSNAPVNNESSQNIVRKDGASNVVMKTNIPPKAPKSIQNYFKPNEINYDEYDLTDIDLDTLKELPVDIQKEILRDKLKDVDKNKKSNKIICKSDIEESGPSSSKLSSYHMPSNKKSEHNAVPEDDEDVEDEASGNILLQSDWPSLIKEWVQSTNSPDEYDVNLFINNVSELIRIRHLVPVHEGLQYLFNVIDYQYNNGAKSCEWHMVYRSIYNQIQEMMQLHQRARLKLKEFKCSCCT